MEEQMLPYARIRTYQAGQFIFSQGEEPEAFYYLLEGLSLTYVVQSDGRERNILISWPGRFFGASTFFEGVRRRASAVALKPCRCAVFDREAYARCRDEVEGFSAMLLQEISRDLGTLFEELADSALLRSDVKVARFICRRMDRGQCQRDGQGRACLPYTQDFIASVLGLSRWQVSRVLSAFQKQGWLQTGYRRMTILAPERLRAYGRQGP